MVVRVHLSPRLFEPEELRGGIALVIDQLRASTTIAFALAHGAAAVLPCEEVEEARRAAAGIPGSLLGGERGGERIEGFDLGNSPSEYGPEVVRGRTIVFTTTNGTRALRRAVQADRVLVGALANLAAVARVLGRSSMPVHLVCAGVHDQVCLDDALCAGAFATQLARAGGAELQDDPAFIAATLWAKHSATSERLTDAMRASRGGRSLISIGLESDVVVASKVSVLDVVPELDRASGLVVRADP